MFDNTLIMRSRQTSRFRHAAIFVTAYFACAIGWAALVFGQGGAVNSPAALVTRAESMQSAERWGEALELAEEALNTLSAKASADSVRLRMKALTIAAESARRQGRRDVAIRHARDHQRDLEKLPATEDFLDLRRGVALSIAEDSVTMGQVGVGEETLQQLVAGRFGTLKRRELLDVLILKGTLAAASRQQAAAEASWREAATLADTLLQNKPPFPIGDQIRFRKRQVIASEGLGQFARAEQQQQQLLAVLERLPNPANSRREASYFLYVRAMMRRDLPRAEEHLRRTLSESETQTVALSRADLLWELASLQRELERCADAKVSLSRCLEAYEATLQAATDRPELVHLRLACWRRLRLLYIEAGRLNDALQVSQQWSRLTLERDGDQQHSTIQAQTALAEVFALRGDYEAALPLLRSASVFWRARPDEPLRLAESLNDLAAVQRGIGQFQEALSNFSESLALRTKHFPEDHPDLATSHRNLASVLVSLGQFARAIELHEKVLSQCERRGRVADGLRATTLLELAVAYKSQGDFPRAVERCRESLVLLESQLESDHFALVPHQVTLSGLARLTRQFDESRQAAEAALSICRKRGREQHELAAAAHLNLGLVHFAQGRWEPAATHLQHARDIDVAGGRLAQAAQTWNRLGLLAFQRGEPEEARVCFESALALLPKDQAKPQERYNTLCNLAFVTRSKNPTLANELLAEAVQTAEAPRSTTFGAERERADFFARYASAFDLLVEWNLQDRQIASAFVNAERSRNRTFLDQLRLAGVDLRSTLPSAARPLLDREAELQQRVQRLRSSSASRDNGEWQQAQRDYADVWRQIRNASPLYRDLLTQRQELLTLDQLCEQFLRPDEVMLFYHLGQASSHVLLLTPRREDIRHASLEITSSATDVLARWMRSFPSENATDQTSIKNSRGTVGLVVSEKHSAVVDVESNPVISRGPLTRRAAAALVTWYLSEIQERRASFDERGPTKLVKSDKDVAVSESYSFLTEVLLPASIRSEVLRHKPRRILIVPDGGLHQLPFEALVLSDEKTTKYLLDDFPPISYAPSANILANLRGRPAMSGEGQSKLLTVGDPNYSHLTTSPEAPRIAARSERVHGDFTREAFLTRAGPLQPLPNTRFECERISEAFRGHPVIMLLGNEATEFNVRKELSRSRWVHFATHGLVDESHDNLFGSIALTTPSSESGQVDDGFLSYNEILGLSLSDCDLAVLSACQTNIGPNRPLESGNSLAQAFLAAGARRVVASLWAVSDQSTSELMGQFFEEVARAESQPTDVIDYGTALQTARKRLRRDRRWSAPYFWAPFVLVGSANR